LKSKELLKTRLCSVQFITIFRQYTKTQAKIIQIVLEEENTAVLTLMILELLLEGILLTNNLDNFVFSNSIMLLSKIFGGITWIYLINIVRSHSNTMLVEKNKWVNLILTTKKLVNVLMLHFNKFLDKKNSFGWMINWKDN